MSKKLLPCILLMLPIFAFGNNDSLWYNVQTLATKTAGKVSVSARLIEDSISFNYYGDELSVLQSVVKFPVALAILNRIDKNEFSLLHKIHFTPQDLKNYSGSTMRDSFYNGNINISFDKLIRYMMIDSDNLSCDALIHHLGKPKHIEKYLRKMNIEDIEIKYNEVALAHKWKNQYKNVGSANAYTLLLERFFLEKILSKTNTDYLLQVMTATATGKNRIVKLLPEGTIVAHKTGTSGSADGVIAAVNDCGIIQLPNGKHLAIAIFITDSKTDMETTESTIAAIAKLMYDTFGQ